jgi:hypothetical protein
VIAAADPIDDAIKTEFCVVAATSIAAPAMQAVDSAAWWCACAGRAERGEEDGNEPSNVVGGPKHLERALLVDLNRRSCHEPSYCAGVRSCIRRVACRVQSTKQMEQASHGSNPQNVIGLSPSVLCRWVHDH